MASDGSVAAGQLTRTATVGVPEASRPMVVAVATVAIGGFATGASPATSIVIVAVELRPQFVPTTWSV